MNVLVLSNMQPFIWGGAEELAHHLVRNLRLRGVNAEVMRIPFSWDPAERLIDEMLLSRSLRVENVDRVIALKFPTYLVPHDNKVLWLLHQYRQAYDLWDAQPSQVSRSRRDIEIRDIVRANDNAAFAQARHIYTIADVTAKRLEFYNGVKADVLRHPLNDPELFVGGECGEYILAAGRVNGAKRQSMFIEAMRHLPAKARLVVAGPPDGEADARGLRERVAAAGLEDRVVLDLRMLPRKELAGLVNNALAVAYAPYDEDSIGYVTMEACQAGKPVVTTTDAGGVLRLVHDGQTGCVSAPEPRALTHPV
jgi:glycosyltransferase involved in cell wall biosynthesis